MRREFIELPEFLKGWDEIGLTDDDLRELEIFLCKYPERGTLIAGTDGVRKLRWSLRKKGKSGGVRTIYIDFASYERIYLLTVYAKSEKDNLSIEEKNNIKSLVRLLESQIKRK